MSQYDAIYPTIRGRAMLTQALREQKALIFTRAEWGDGVKKENQPSDLFEGLIHKVIESGFTKKEQDGNVLFLTTVYDNSKLNEGFYVREVGVYAKVGEDGQEYLYAYTYANIASYTPPSKQYNEKRLKIGLAVDKAAKIEIKFNSQQYATREELDLHNADAAAHAAAFLIHNKDTNAHKVLFDKFVKDVKIKSKAENSFTVTKGDNSTTTVTINNVEHASNADTAGVANAVKARYDGQIKYDLSNRPANADTSILYNWAAADRTRRIQEYAFYDGTGSGTLSVLKAKWLTGDVKGNADTSSVSNSIAITRGNEIVLTGTPNNQEQVWLGYRSEGYTGSPVKKWKFGDLKLGLAAVEAKEFIGPATVLKGIYTQNGGKQPLGYFGRNTVGALMSNESVMGDTSYKNWLYMDHYDGSDAGGATAFGISRTGTRAFIARSNSDRGPIVDSAELLTTKGGHIVSGSMTFNGTVTTKSGIIIPTRSRGDNTTYAASTAFVQDAINALINGSPGALDTLKELAAALGNDANFASTIAKQLGLKAPLASPSFTGTVTGPTPSSSANNTQFATTAWVLSRISALATGPIIGDVSSANGWWIKIPCVGFNLLIQGG
ncbi:hypothetical protein, partial [Veillonella magna]|uniref:hypothetical protein n=1 Tax=Veillonella magna TaxID=464322 RepID=UPI0026DD62B2